MEAIFDYPTGPKVDSRIIFIKGENSDYIQDQYLNQIMRQFPQAEFETIGNAGHWLHAEQPEALVQVLQSYLADY
jgi:esterase